MQLVIDGAYADIDRHNEQLASLGLTVRIARTLTVEPVEPPNDLYEQPDDGYTGNLCSVCDSDRMIRSGTCETCQNCFTNTGCG